MITRPLALLTVLVSLLVAVPAKAACVNPPGLEGEAFYNADHKVPQFCDGSQWWGMKNQGFPPCADGQTIVMTSSGWGCGSGVGCGDNTTGFYVMSSGSWNGDLITAAGGGLTALDAANSLCLADLTANDWRCKGSAQSRGLLNVAKVRASLCTSTTCQDLTADTRYYFAKSGSATTGGSFFTSDASGRGYGYGGALDWNGVFNTNTPFWSNKSNGGGASQWGPGPEGANDCSGWSNATNGFSGSVGVTNTHAAARFHQSDVTCDNAEPLLCAVNP